MCFLSEIRWPTLQVARSSPTAVFPCVSEFSVRKHWRGLRRSIYGKTNPHEDDELFNVHIVIFTGAASRTVHLDIGRNTGSSAFLRRGIPSLMISDNATCFKSEEVRLSEELLRLGIRRKLIVESSPRWGGFWERLINSITRSLNRIIFRALVNYEELLTTITEIEAIMNSRPLTYIGNEVDEILTPEHLLMGKRILKENNDTFDEHEVNYLHEQVT